MRFDTGIFAIYISLASYICINSYVGASCWCCVLFKLFKITIIYFAMSGCIVFAKYAKYIMIIFMKFVDIMKM